MPINKQTINDNIRKGFTKIGQNTYKGNGIVICQKEDTYYGMIFNHKNQLLFNTPKYDCPILTKEVAKAFIVKGGKPTPTQINKLREGLNQKELKPKREVEYFQGVEWGPFGIFQ